METIRKELQSKLDELNSKLGHQEDLTEDDLKVLLFARLMEEELNEQRRSQ